MNRRKRPFWLLAISFLSLGGLIYLIFFYSPSSELRIANYELPIIPIFFLLLFAFLLSIISYLLRNVRRAAFIAALAIIYLIFRMLNLNNPYFPLLLLALFLSLELFFKKRV